MAEARWALRRHGSHLPRELRCCFARSVAQVQGARLHDRFGDVRAFSLTLRRLDAGGGLPNALVLSGGTDDRSQPVEHWSAVAVASFAAEALGAAADGAARALADKCIQEHVTGEVSIVGRSGANTQREEVASSIHRASSLTRTRARASLASSVCNNQPLLLCSSSCGDGLGTQVLLSLSGEDLVAQLGLAGDPFFAFQAALKQLTEPQLASPHRAVEALDGRLSTAVVRALSAEAGSNGAAASFPIEYIRRCTHGFAESHVIGHGSFGTVFRAVDPVVGVRFAVKRLNADTMASAPPRRRAAEQVRRRHDHDCEVLVNGR